LVVLPTPPFSLMKAIVLMVLILYVMSGKVETFLE